MKIKIVEPGWAGYTGFVGQIEFVDGVSSDINATQAFGIAAIIRVEGTEGENITAMANAEMAGVVEAPIVNYKTKAETEPEVIENNSEEGGEPVVPAGFYTREDLEAIADARGITGLREIADPMGVKGTSIAKLIEGVLAKVGG